MNGKFKKLHRNHTNHEQMLSFSLILLVGRKIEGRYHHIGPRTRYQQANASSYRIWSRSLVVEWGNKDHLEQ